MYPPKIKKPQTQVFGGSVQYLSDAKKDKLLGLKNYLESRSPSVLIKQLYADTQAATLRAIAACRKHSPAPAIREIPKRVLADQGVESPAGEDFDASFEATSARVLAKELEHTCQTRLNNADGDARSLEMEQKPLKKMQTAELVEEFKGIDWANISEYKAHEFGLALQREQVKAHEKQQALLRDLNKQIDEHEIAKRNNRDQERAYFQLIMKNLQEWEASEKEKVKRAKEIMEQNREEIEQALQMRAIQKEKDKDSKLKEDQLLIRRTMKEVERQKRRDLRDKLRKREMVKEMMMASQEEHRKARLREVEEKKQDLVLLQQSIRLEEEAEVRRIIERQRQIVAHQSRVDRIAEALKDDKVERATRNAIARHEREQAELDKKALALQMEKMEAVKQNAAYLQLQAAEKQARRKAEAHERRKLQLEYESDAAAYLVMVEEKERQKRAENIKQQELLLQQIEEQKKRTDLCVSATELKMNKNLLEKVKAFKEQQQLLRASKRASDNHDSEEERR